MSSLLATAGRDRRCARRADDLFSGSPPLAFTFGLGGLLLFPLRIGAATLLLEKCAPEALLAAIAAISRRACCSPRRRRIARWRRRSGQIRSVEPAQVRRRGRGASGGDAQAVEGRDRHRHHRRHRHDGNAAHLHFARRGARETRRDRQAGPRLPRLRDGRSGPAAAGGTESGRLAVKGPTGCRYLADERQKDYVKDGWNYTGDAYSIDEDGYFVYQARTDDMIISAGYNIAGPEVEDALLLHPAVAECGVIGAPDEQRGQIVKAFVVLKTGHVADAAMAHELQEFVKRAIAPYKYPRAIEFTASLPRTETGKLQRFRLRQREPAEAPQRP